MWNELGECLRQLGRRAGVTGVPVPVIAAALGLCALACVWGAWRFWPREAGGTGVSPESFTVEGVGADAPGAAESELELSATARRTVENSAAVVVHVAGAVRHPDIYQLPAGSRVADAVRSAGGALPDACLEAVNLARVLADGDQVLIPDEDDVSSGVLPPVAGVGGSGAGVSVTGAMGSAGTAGPVDLNTADVASLDTLPGIGPATAARIVADREANGPFRSVQDLTRVSGIGEKKVAQLEGLACVR